MSRSIFTAFVLLLSANSARAETELRQVVSRENAVFDCRSAVLCVGRDGRVFLSNQQSPGHVLRFERDGSGKVGGTVVYAMGNATANGKGIVATANAHFA